jgi:hypothetical protein
MAERRGRVAFPVNIEEGGLTGRSAFALVLVVVTVVFNLAMLGVFLNLRGDLRAEQERAQDCPEGWAGEGCLGGLQGAELGMGFLRLFWVVGAVLLGSAWVVLGVIWLDRSDRRQPVPVGPAWLVAPPGAEAGRFIIGNTLAGFLAAGTMVTEVRRWGEQVRVTAPDGLCGWVDADRLEPTVQPTGEEGGGDG